MKTDATFEITGWEQDSYDAPDDGPPLTRGTVRTRFGGGIEGESVAEPLTCGELSGLRGSVAVEHGLMAFEYEL